MGALRQPTHDRFPVADEADAGALRRAVAGYAERLYASEEGSGRAQLVATELATNLLRHAKPGGWVLARPLPPASVELIAVDRGPGIAELPALLAGQRPRRAADPGAERSPWPWGGGGLGCGLAAVRRASACFDVHTGPDLGSTVLAVVDLGGPLARDQAPAAVHRTWAGISVGMRPESGDGWAVAAVDGGLAVIVVDGLGHGPAASAAADAALDAFAADPVDLDGFAVRANAAMRNTRGGAVTVCRLDQHRAELSCLAVGNVSGRIVAGGTERGLLAYGGTLGLRASPPRARVVCYPWPPDALLVLWTDGLRSRLDLTDAGLLRHDPAVVAAALHRAHSRDRDDATVVVIRGPTGTGAP